MCGKSYWASVANAFCKQRSGDKCFEKIPTAEIPKKEYDANEMMRKLFYTSWFLIAGLFEIIKVPIKSANYRAKCIIELYKYMSKNNFILWNISCRNMVKTFAKHPLFRHVCISMSF